MIDIKKKTVKLIAGTGRPGYYGDGGNPLNAAFGGNTNEYFDGPWSLAIDELNNFYIGDTQNHVIRMIDSQRNLF